MKLVGLILRLYSYLYHLVLCLICLAIGTVTAIGGLHTLNLPMLPWKGVELTHYLLLLSIFGLLCTLLAATGIFRWLFPGWCVFVAWMMIKGFILGPFVYSGEDHFRSVLWLIAGALGALLSSLQLFKSKQQLSLKS